MRREAFGPRVMALSKADDCGLSVYAAAAFNVG